MPARDSLADSNVLRLYLRLAKKGDAIAVVAAASKLLLIVWVNAIVKT
jgi:hypothetical protein